MRVGGCKCMLQGMVIPDNYFAIFIFHFSLFSIPHETTKLRIEEWEMQIENLEQLSGASNA